MKLDRRALAVPAVLAALLAAGCSTRYKMTDVQTNTDYYTTSVDHMSDGSYRFKDDATGQTIRLEQTRVIKVSSAEYWDHVPSN